MDRKMMENVSRGSATFLAVTLVAACGQDVEVQSEPVVRPVKLLTLEAASNQESRRYPGVVAAAQSSDLSFQVGGLLEQLLVIEAQEMEEGALVAQLDQRDFQSQAASAGAQFDNAEEEYQRAVRLAAEDAIARSILEQREAQRDVARAQLDSAEKALSDSTLRAPFSGIVASVPASARQIVQPGQIIATLIGANSLEAQIDLPANVIAFAGTRTETGASVTLDVAPNDPIDATFKEATLIGDATSQTYAITFEFMPPDEIIVLPGMNVTVELTSSQNEPEENRVSVPLAAVMSDGSSQYVWIVDEPTMTVSRRAVTIEEGIGENAIVTQGLSIGETIAGAGANYLSEGMQIRPWTD